MAPGSMIGGGVSSSAAQPAQRVKELRSLLRQFYDAVDKAQRIDNTGGDSAVSVTLWSWAEILAMANVPAAARPASREPEAPGVVMGSGYAERSLGAEAAPAQREYVSPSTSLTEAAAVPADAQADAALIRAALPKLDLTNKDCGCAECGWKRNALAALDRLVAALPGAAE